MTSQTKTLVVAAFVVLGHTRVRDIDLGAAGAQLLAAMEIAAPGSSARLMAFCPEPLARPARRKIRRQFASDSRRKPGRVSKVDPIKGQPVDAHEFNGRT